MAGQGRVGRPSKGARRRVEVRVPVLLAEALETAAAQDGQAVSDWVTELLAERLGLPYPRQERLPLSAA
jgi:predicted HicB family RNase H-like nuclease